MSRAASSLALDPFSGFEPPPRPRVSVGNTPLVRARNLERDLGVPRLWLKLEGENVTGTHKDRAAQALVNHAITAGRRGVGAGSCGSLGLALAHAAREAKLECIVHIPRRYESPGIARIVAMGARIIRSGGGYEEAVAASRMFARRSRILDANPVGLGGQIAMMAYGAIAREIAQALGHVPSLVLVPCGNGTTLAGIAQGFAALGAGMPRLCAAGSVGNTAVTAGIRAGHVVVLEPHALRESAINEPLLNWRSFQAREALDAVIGSGGTAIDASDEELLAETRHLLGREGIRCLPASSAVLVALARLVEPEMLDHGDVVAVMTGRPS